MTAEQNKIRIFIKPIVINIHFFIFLITLSNVYPLNVHVDTICLKENNIDWTHQNGWNFLCFIMLKITIVICCIIIGRILEIWKTREFSNYWTRISIVFVIFDIIATILFIGNLHHDKCFSSWININNIIDVQKTEIVVFIMIFTSFFGYVMGLYHSSHPNDIPLLQYCHFLISLYVISNLLSIVYFGFLYYSHQFGIDMGMICFEINGSWWLDNLMSLDSPEVLGTLVCKMVFIIACFYFYKSIENKPTNRKEICRINIFFLSTFSCDMGINYLVINYLTRFKCSDGKIFVFPEHTFLLYLIDVGIVLSSFVVNYSMGTETKTKRTEKNQKYVLLQY